MTSAIVGVKSSDTDNWLNQYAYCMTQHLDVNYDLTDRHNGVA